MVARKAEGSEEIKSHLREEIKQIDVKEAGSDFFTSRD
jgi:hypothetical protein